MGFELALFAGLGFVAGTLSGMLGIGGGMVIVPGLFYLFGVLGLPEHTLMHLAAGTAMCIMIFTSAASTISHHLKGDVQWGFFRRMIGAIGVGVVIGHLMSKDWDTHWLEAGFGVFLLAVSLKILLDWKPGTTLTEVPGLVLTLVVGLLVGFKSGVLGIGGGAISVPFLLFCGLSMKEASGTSASFTLPISLVGALVFGLLAPTFAEVTWSTGYIYWPAVAMVAPFTMLGAPLGTQLSHWLPAHRLRQIFAVLLLFIGGRMLQGGLQGFV
jgi:uncharacterized protein